MTEPTIAVITVEVLAKTAEASQKLVELVESINKSIQAFKALPTEAEKVAGQIAVSFEKVKTSVINLSEPIAQINALFLSMASVAQNAARDIQAPFDKLVIDDVILTKLATLSATLKELKGATEGIKLSTVATGLNNIITSLKNFAKADEDLAKLDSATIRLSTAFSRLLVLVKELQGGKEGLFKLQKIVLEAVDGKDFLRSITKIQEDAIVLISAFATTVNSLEKIPLRFTIGSIDFPKGDEAKLKSYVADLQAELKEFFVKFKIQLPPLGYSDFSDSLKGAKNQVDTQFRVFIENIKSLLQIQVNAQPFVKYAAEVEAAVKSATASTQDLRGILNALKTMTTIELVVKFPSTAVFTKKIKELNADIQRQLDALGEVFAGHILEIKITNVLVRVLESTKAVLTPGSKVIIENEIKKSVKVIEDDLKKNKPVINTEIDIKALVPAGTSTAFSAVQSQIGTFSSVSSEATLLIDTLIKLGTTENSLATHINLVNEALAKDTNSIKNLKAVASAMSQVIEAYSLMFAKVGKEKITPVDLSGVLGNITLLVDKYQGVLGVSTAIRESQNVIIESSTRVIAALNAEKEALAQIAKLVTDAMKVMEFKQATSVKLIDETQLTKELQSVRIFTSSIESARAGVLALSESGTSNAFVSQLNEMNTKALTLATFLKKSSIEKSALAKITSAEAGPDVKPQTLQGFRTLVDSVNEYVSSLMRANETISIGTTAVQNQAKLLNVFKEITDNNVNSLGKENEAYSSISKTLQTLLSTHQELLASELKEFKSETDVNLAFEERTKLLKGIKDLIATTKGLNLDPSAAGAKNLDNIISQLLLVEEAFKAPIPVINAFKRDNVLAAESVDLITKKIKDLSISSESIKIKGIDTPKIYTATIESLASLKQRALDAKLSIEELNKSGTLSFGLKSTLDVQAGAITSIIANLQAYGVELKALNEDKKLANEKDVLFAKSTVEVADAISKITNALNKEKDTLTKLSEGTVTLGTGQKYITKDLDAVRNNLQTKFEEIKKTIMSYKTQINSLLEEGSYTKGFANIGDLKNIFGTIDVSSSAGLSGILKILQEIDKAELELAKHSKDVVYTPSSGLSGNLSKTAAAINSLEGSFSKLNQVILQVQSSETSVELFNKLKESARQGALSISRSAVEVVSALKAVQSSSSINGNVSGSLFLKNFEGTDAANSLNILKETLKSVQQQFSGLGVNTSFLQKAVGIFESLGNASSTSAEKIKALNDTIKLLETTGSGVSSIISAINSELNKISVTNAIKTLPEAFTSITAQIKDVIAETQRLNEVTSKTSKSTSHYDFQLELLQLKELSKESNQAQKAIDELLKVIAHIGAAGNKNILFDQLKDQTTGLKAALESLGIKINITSAETAFKSVFDGFYKLKEGIQGNAIQIKLNTGQVTEAAKSTSAFGDAIFQATGMHNTMRALTEEGSLLSKGISSYFTSIAGSLKIGKESVLDFQKGLISLEDELVRLRSGVVTWSMGVMMMGQAMVAPFIGAVKGFADFGDTMKMVQAVSESTDAKLQSLTATTLQLTAASRFDPKAASEGLLALARAGYSANDAIAALPVVLRMAQAGALAVGESAEIVTHLMHTFQLGIEATGKTTDILVKAANESTANVSDLGHSFTYVGALAKGFGVSMEETVGALGALANVGFTGCYDDQTEILTKTRGFQLFKDLVPNEEVMTINKDTLVMEWQAIEDQVWRYSLNGSPMFHIQTQSLDLNVTPNHRMFIETRVGVRKIVLAEDLKEGKFFRSGVWEGIDNPIFVLPGLEQNRVTWIKSIPNLEINMMDWIKFLAWYLSEGSLHQDAHGNYRIRITQSKEANPEKCKLIEELLERLPFNFSYAKSNNTYECRNQQLYIELEKYGKGFANKIIPQYVKDLPASYLQEFYETFCLGDGVKQGTLYTSGKQLAEDLYEIVVKAGYAAQLKLLNLAGTEVFSKSFNRTLTSTKDQYCIYVSKCHITPWVSLWEQDKKSETTSNKIGYENYTGFVYSVIVPNTIVFVRRNGKSVFCGNTMAGTALRGMLEHLFNPTKDEAVMMEELSKRIGGVGLQIKDSEGNFIGFAAVIRQLEKAGFTSAEALRLFGQRAGPGVAAMMKLGSAGLDEFNAKMYTAEGTAGAMSQMMESSLQGRFELMTRAIQSFSMALAGNLEAPLKMAADAITTIVVGLTNFHTALGPVAQVLDIIAASLTGFMAVAGSATFAWFLMVVPVTQFLGFIRLLVAVMEVGKTSLLVNAAAGQVLAAQQMREIAILTGVTIQTAAATTVTELNTMAKIHNNEATLAQGLAEMRAALMSQGLTVAQVEQTMAMTANSMAMAVNSDAALLLAKNTAIADLANRGFFATLGAFGKMMLSQLASGLAALGTYIINAVKSIYALVAAQGVLGAISIGLSGILTYLKTALIRVSIAAMEAWAALMGPIGVGILAVVALGVAIYGVYLAMTEVERAKENALKFDKEAESIKKFAGDIKDAKAALKDLLVTRLEGEIKVPNVILDQQDVEKTIQEFSKLEQDALKHGNKDIALEYKFNIKTNTQDVALRFKDELIPIVEAGKALPEGIQKAMAKFDTAAIDTKAKNLDDSLKNFKAILEDGLQSQGIISTLYHEIFNVPIVLDSGQNQKQLEAIDQNKVMFSKWYENQKEIGTKFSGLKTAEIIKKYWESVYSGTLAPFSTEKLTGSLTAYIEELKKTDEKLKAHQPLQVSLISLDKNSSDFKAALIEFNTGLDEATKKMAEKFKTGFDAAGKYLTEFTAINSESSKDQIKTLENASAERLAIAKKDADMTGTYEATVAEELIKTTNEKTKILIDGLKIEENIRKSMMDTSQGLGPELKIEAEKGFIDVLTKEKNVYQDSVASMIAESAKLADVINGLEKNYRSFHESILASQAKVMKDPNDVDDTHTMEAASLEAKKKIAEAKKAFLAGNYAEEFRLAQEAKAKLDAIDNAASKSFNTQDKKKIFNQYAEIDEIAKQSATTLKGIAQEKENALQENIKKTNLVIQTMAVNMSQVGVSIEGSVNKMTEAVNKLLTALIEVSKAKGFDINPATNALALNEELQKMKASIDAAEILKTKIAEITKVFDVTGKLSGGQQSLEYLKTLDLAFTDLHKASIGVFAEFSKEGEDFNLQTATTSLDIFKTKLNENKKAQEDLLLVLRTAANEPGISPQMKTGIEAQITEVEKFKNIITNDLNTLNLLDPSTFEQNKEKFLQTLTTIRTDFTKFTDHTYVVNVDVADNLLAANLERIKEKLKTAVSTQDLMSYKTQLTDLLSSAVEQGLSATLIKSTKNLLKVITETISTMSGIEPKIGISPNPEKSSEVIQTQQIIIEQTKTLEQQTQKIVEAKQKGLTIDQQVLEMERLAIEAERKKTEEIEKGNNAKDKSIVTSLDKGTVPSYSLALPTQELDTFGIIWTNLQLKMEEFSKKIFKVNLDTSDIKTAEGADAKVKEIIQALVELDKAKQESAGRKLDPENLKAYNDKLEELRVTYLNALVELKKPLVDTDKTKAEQQHLADVQNAADVLLNSLRNPTPPILISVIDKALAPIQVILQSIDLLRDKSITITTNYVSTGTPKATGGLMGDVIAKFALGGDVFTRPSYSVVPGSGSGDKIPALLEPNEFIMKKSAVQKFGVDFMYRLNAGILQFKQTGGLIPAFNSPLNFNSIQSMNDKNYNMPSSSGKTLDEVNINLQIGNHPVPFVVKSNREQAHELLSVLKNIGL